MSDDSTGEIDKAFALMDENIIIHGRVTMVPSLSLSLLHLLFSPLSSPLSIFSGDFFLQKGREIMTKMLKMALSAFTEYKGIASCVSLTPSSNGTHPTASSLPLPLLPLPLPLSVYVFC
jgi:hypothetical protein